MRYMDTAGDQDCLGWDTGGGVTILQKLIETGLEMNRTFAKGRSDGLLDVGAGTGKMLEIEEDDYQHVIGAVNTMAVNYYHTLARWCDQKNSSCVDTFKSLGEDLNAQVNAQLWDDDLGWYGNKYPGEEKPRTVLSYHTLEALRSFGPERFAAAVPASRRERMLSRFREGELLAPTVSTRPLANDASHALGRVSQPTALFPGAVEHRTLGRGALEPGGLRLGGRRAVRRADGPAGRDALHLAAAGAGLAGPI